MTAPGGSSRERAEKRVVAWCEANHGLAYDIFVRQYRIGQDWEDELQSAVCCLLDNVETWLEFDDQTLNAYICTTLRRRALDFLRHRRRQQPSSQFEPKLIAAASMPDRDLSRKQELTVQVLLEIATDAERDLIYRRQYSGQSYAQIAIARQKSEESLREEFSRLKKRLAAEVERRMAE